jgi:hypothetical protein
MHHSMVKTSRFVIVGDILFYNSDISQIAQIERNHKEISGSKELYKEGISFK